MELNEKLTLWVKLTGIDPTKEQATYTINLCGTHLGSYDIKCMNDKIKEALSYDDSGLFADAYLCVYFDKFIKNKEISVKEMIENPDTKKFLEDAERLYMALQESHSAEKILMDASKAMEFYDMSADNLTVFDIAEIRTSAQRCMDDKLKVLQFSAGKPSENGFKMTKDIYMYRDLDAMLYCAANNTIDGVSLGYIRDAKKITDSYFAFIIKNGENLYLLTDKPKYVHPLQKENSRCPGRDMFGRTETNMFPYETIAAIDTSDLWGSGRYGTKEIDASNERLLTKDDMRVKIGVFADMSSDEAFWTVLMISMIRDRFYKEIPQYELSYSGSMIHSKEIEASECSLVIRKELPTMELKNIESITDTEDFGCKYEYPMLDYIINRYKDKVDNSLLNLINGTEQFKLVDKEYSYKCGFMNRDIYHPIIAFDSNTACGTKDEILKDQRWIARYNYAYQINNLAKQDYKENADSIKRKIRNILCGRLRDLCIDFVKSKLDCPAEKYTFNNWYGSHSMASFPFGYNWFTNKKDMTCIFSGKAPGVVIKIVPENIEQLAQICDCKVSDFPEQIQHWKKNNHRYTGNCLLDRLDPLSFMVNDPFLEMNFSITILLSKKEYLAICNEASMSKDEFWKNVPPTCYNNSEGCSGNFKKDKNLNYILMEKCKKCKYLKGE